MQTDRPIQTAAEDRFDRAPFARRIAEVIRTRQDPATLVIGIYGPWGDGKSSTLALIKEALGATEGIVKVDYNPWFFSSSIENLTRSFFFTLGDALENTKLFSRERVGGLLKKYGGIVPKFGGVIKAAGEALSITDIKTIRSQVEVTLNKHKTPIVVFVDDVDRLDRKEIQTLFKLIRLAADFPYIIYVLAFDDEIVASALGEAYEGGDAAAGHRFLDKIVQSPLHMPRANSEVLRKIVFEGVDAMLKANNIALNEQEVYGFANNFAMSFQPLMRTPRQAKLYENAITFSIPILHSEVNIVDLLLLEALRIFVPRLYLAIRDNPDVFLKGKKDERDGEESFNKFVDKILDREGVNAQERIAIVSHTLTKLFPRTSKMGYGDEWDRIWAKEKRICTSDYFARFFRYGVPSGDIEDRLIDKIIAGAIAGELETLSAHFAVVTMQSAYPAFIRKLRIREAEIPLEAIISLVEAIAIAANELPREPSSMLADWTIKQTAILTSQLAQRLPSPDERIAVIEMAISKSASLVYSVELLRWVRYYTEDSGKSHGFLEEGEIRELTAVIVDKLRADAKSVSLYRYLADDTVHVLYWWVLYGDGVALKASVAKSIKEEGPDGAEALIQVCCGRSWDMSTGIPHTSDVREDVYRTISDFVDPELIIAVLRTRYGSKLNAPEFYVDENVKLGERLARQFAFIHLKANKKKEGQGEGGSIADEL